MHPGLEEGKGFQLTRSRGAWLVENACVKNVYSFQLTRSRGAWPRLTDKYGLVSLFQLTRSRGAWHALGAGRLKHMVISTHTLTWSVTTGKRRRISITGISTHTLTWSVTFGSLVYLTLKKFQLTRSRGAWPVTKPTDLKADKISTHTLTWSVTGGSAPPQSFRPISTHTLTWSVTCAWRRALKTYGHFNSHAHVERDNRKTPPHFDNWHFNSHAHVERDGYSGRPCR